MPEPSRANSDLPPIPAKRYFTIGEVSDLCAVKPHVLRYWEQEFAQLKPVKRRGNRRYYQHHEVLLIRRIRDLLYEQGFTINGARHRLESRGGRAARGGARDDQHRHRRRRRRRRTRSSPPRSGRSSRRFASFCARRDCVRRYNSKFGRGVAQPGSAPAWGAGGRVFESLRPDHSIDRTHEAGLRKRGPAFLLESPCPAVTL